MKNVKLSYLAFLLVIAACTSSTEKAEPQRKFETFSSTSGFTFQYDAELNLDSPTPTRTVVTNTKLAGSAPVSEVVLDTQVAAGVTTFGELSEYAKKQRPRASFTLYKNARGTYSWRSERRMSRGRELHYYFFSPTNAVVSVVVLMRDNSPQNSFLLSVAETMELDTQAPTIASVEVSSSKFIAGDVPVVTVTATDNLVGVGELEVELRPEGAYFYSNASVRFRAAARSVGANRYELDLAVPAWTISKRYRVITSVFDRAGNVAVAKADPLVEIDNVGKLDEEAPKLWKVEAPRELTPGKKNVIYVMATDDLSGVVEGRCDSYTALSLRRPGHLIDVQAPKISKCLIQRVPAPVGSVGERYAISFYLSEFSDAGSFFVVRVMLTDLAGNEAVYQYNFAQKAYETFKAGKLAHALSAVAPELKIGSDKVLPQPKILSFRFTKLQTSAGDNLTFEIELDQDISEDEEFFGSLTLHKAVEGDHFRPAEITFQRRAALTPTANPKVVSGEIKVHQWAPRGEVILGALEIGNSARQLLTRAFWTSGGRTALPAQTIPLPTVLIRD